MSANEMNKRNNNRMKAIPPSWKNRVTNSSFIEAGQGDINEYLSHLEANSKNKMAMVLLSDLKKKFGYFNNLCRRIEVLENSKNNMENCLGYDDLLSTLHNLIDSHSESKREVLTLKENNDTLIKENTRLHNLIDIQRESKHNILTLKETNDTLIKDNHRLKEKINTVIKENKRLTKLLDDLVSPQSPNYLPSSQGSVNSLTQHSPVASATEHIRSETDDGNSPHLLVSAPCAQKSIGGTNIADADSPVLSVTDPDTADAILTNAFIMAVLFLESSADSSFPMTMPVFFVSHVKPNCFPGLSINLKQTSYGKFSSFMEAAESLKIVKLNSSADGDLSLMSVDYQHYYLVKQKKQQFYKHLLEQVSNRCTNLTIPTTPGCEVIGHKSSASSEAVDNNIHHPTDVPPTPISFNESSHSNTNSLLIESTVPYLKSSSTNVSSPTVSVVKTLPSAPIVSGNETPPSQSLLNESENEASSISKLNTNSLSTELTETSIKGTSEVSAPTVFVITPSSAPIVFIKEISAPQLLNSNKVSSCEASPSNSSASSQGLEITLLKESNDTSLQGTSKLSDSTVIVEEPSPTSWVDLPTKDIKWNQELINKQDSKKCIEHYHSICKNRTGWGVHRVNNMTGSSANGPKTISNDLNGINKTLTYLPNPIIDKNWVKPGWGKNPNKKKKLMTVLQSDGGIKTFFSQCVQKQVCHNEDLTKVIAAFYGECLFKISCKDKPTLDEIYSVEDIYERNMILFKIDPIYKIKILFPDRYTLLHYATRHQEMVNQLCKYLFTHQAQIMNRWIINVNLSCKKRTSDVCTGVPFDQLEERYYQCYFIALCHNMSLLLNILTDSFLCPCPLTLVRTEASGTPSVWNKLFKLDVLFDIPDGKNAFCKSKNCNYLSILQHCRDLGNFAHQGAYIFVTTVFTSIQEDPDFKPFLKEHCDSRYTRKYEKRLRQGGNTFKFQPSVPMQTREHKRAKTSDVQYIEDPYNEESRLMDQNSDSDGDSCDTNDRPITAKRKSRSS